MTPTLRPYQQEAVAAIRQAMARHRSVLFVLPTGEGNANRRRKPTGTFVPTMPATKTCAVEGCDRPVDSHGFCAMHAQRFRRYGDPLYITPEPTRRASNRAAQLARFESNSIKSTTYRKLHGRHEHRVVAEQKLGRPLLPGEIVHHIDGNKHNNHPDNLEIMTQSDHIREHFAHDRSLIEWDGQAMYPKQWAEALGISTAVFHNRRRAGWPMERIASTPVRNWRRRSD